MSLKRRNSQPSELVPKKLENSTKKPIEIFDEISTKILPENVLAKYIKPAGQVLVSGCLKWRIQKDTEEDQPNENYFYRRFTNAKYRFITSGCTAGHSILIKDDGTVMGFGRNGHKELGLTGFHIDFPTEIGGFEGINIISAACGASHTLFLSDNGQVFAVGDNSFGQCGLPTRKNAKIIETPQLINYTGAPIVKIDCGSRFSALLDIDGNLHTFGHPEFGVIGNNTEGKTLGRAYNYEFSYVTSPKLVAAYFQRDPRSKKMELVPNVKIVDFSCGSNHIIAIDNQQRAFSWGNGDYGKLGHNNQDNQLVPIMILFFARNGHRYKFERVACGHQYSLTVIEGGELYLMGKKYVTKNVALYPQHVADLNGYPIAEMAMTFNSTILLSNDKLIVWGSCRKAGVLGLGDEKKNSPQPSINEACTGMKILQITMGYAHSMLLVDTSDSNTKKIYKKFKNVVTV